MLAMAERFVVLVYSFSLLLLEDAYALLAAVAVQDLELFLVQPIDFILGVFLIGLLLVGILA